MLIRIVGSAIISITLTLGCVIFVTWGLPDIGTYTPRDRIGVLFVLSGLFVVVLACPYWNPKNR